MKLKTSQYVLICLILLAASYMLLAILRWWYADAQFAKGKSLSDQGYVSDALVYFQAAIKLMPGEPLFHNELSDTAAKIAFGLTQQSATEAARQATQLAIAESDTTIALNQVHLNFWKTRIRLWLILAQIDPNFYTNAITDLKAALSLSPTDAKLMYNLGVLELQLGQPATARLTLEQTVVLKPNYEAARLELGKLYQSISEIALARQQYQYILDHISPQNKTVLDLLNSL